MEHFIIFCHVYWSEMKFPLSYLNGIQKWSEVSIQKMMFYVSKPHLRRWIGIHIWYGWWLTWAIKEHLVQTGTWILESENPISYHNLLSLLLSLWTPWNSIHSSKLVFGENSFIHPSIPGEKWAVIQGWVWRTLHRCGLIHHVGKETDISNG